MGRRRKPHVSQFTENDFLRRQKMKRENPNWIDGDAYMRSDAWKELRALVFQRDGKRCVLCTYWATTVHHWHYRTYGRETGSELASLCGGCHKAEHKLGRANREWFWRRRKLRPVRTLPGTQAEETA